MKALLIALLTVLAFLFLLPIAWWINFAVKGNASLTIGDTLKEIWIPNEFLLFHNLQSAFNLYPMGRFFINSLIVASVVTFFELFIASLAGFSFAKYDFKGKNIVFSAILSLLMIPQVVLVIPLFEVVVALDMVNTYRSLVLPFLVTPFGIFMMRQFCYSIPNDYIEAARVEGVGEFTIYLRIIIPLIKSAFALLGIFTFLRQWDMLLWPLITLSKQAMYTLAVGVSLLQTNVQVPYNALYAVTLLFSIPVIIMYLLFQRLIIESLTMSGIKG
ncbi:MAG TPA: carbohydrate ABC transporter permease [archaeon]|nr:carbohydrate ABC transporter permease [archaeon]